MSATKDDVVPQEGAICSLVSNIRCMIEQELEVKQIPSGHVSIMQNGKRVYTEGFGYQDEKHTVPVTSETVFRVGSITKLFTDMALMLAVEEGKIDLDEPVERYLPAFQPKNPFKTRLTTRHLVTHHGGLAREPPVGHYFDSDPSVTLEATAMSLNSTSLIHEPGTVFKYSNAAIAVVGLILEKLYAKSWAVLMRELLLEPLDMQRSEFIWSDRIAPHLAYGAMYSQDNRLDRNPPLFELGEAPAGSLYSTTTDLEKFAKMILNRGVVTVNRTNPATGAIETHTTQVFKPETLDEIFRVQYPDSDRKGIPHLAGIGWQLMTYQGIPIASHGGAVYGYTARLVISREKDFSLVLLCSGDCAITTIKNISNYILQHYGRLLNGETTFPVRKWSEISKSDMVRFEGAFIETGEGKPQHGYDQKLKFRRRMHLDHRFGQFMLRHDAGYSRLKLTESADSSADLLTFDVSDRFIDYETMTLSKDGKKIKWYGVDYERIEFEIAPELHPELDRFIGEYGPDHAPAYVFERYGRLFVLLEWMMQYPLHPTADPNVWQLPSEDCFYVDEQLVFCNFDANGVPMSVECTGMMFERRLKDVASDTTFKIDSLKSIDDLRRDAMTATPPEALTKAKLTPDLVDMTKIDETLQFDIRYATENNFMGAAFYKLSKAFAQRPASQAILKAHNWLKQHGYGMVIFDIYRPWHVTKMFYEATPLKLRHFVAAPSVGSIHNRGCAIDCGLYELSTGKQITMVSGFDEMTPRSYRDYPGGTTRQRWYQTLLRTAMQQFDFEVYEYEWWHFNFASQNDYPVMNVAFEDIAN